MIRPNSGKVHTNASRHQAWLSAVEAAKLSLAAETTTTSSAEEPVYVNGHTELAPLTEIFQPRLEDLDSDLRSPVESKRDTPQNRAKAVRAAFSARGWPDAEHPGTVREFLEEWGIPLVEHVPSPL